MYIIGSDQLFGGIDTRYRTEPSPLAAISVPDTVARSSSGIVAGIVAKVAGEIECTVRNWQVSTKSNVQFVKDIQIVFVMDRFDFYVRPAVVFAGVIGIVSGGSVWMRARRLNRRHGSRNFD